MQPDYSCFPHVINLCVKAGIRQLTELPFEDTPIPQEDSDEFINDLEEETSRYSSILADDVVAAARHLVTAIRASGQRREDFAMVIAEGNKAGVFGLEGLREVVLLKDMDVRWSSTFLMIDRVLELYPVSNSYYIYL